MLLGLSLDDVAELALLPAGPFSLDIGMVLFPLGDVSVTTLYFISDVADVMAEQVEGFNGFVFLSLDVPLALPVIADGLGFTCSHQFLIFKIINPLWLEQIEDLDASVELLDVATEDRQRQAQLVGEDFNEVLEVLALIHLVIADGDEGLIIVEELDSHALHVQLGL